MSLIKSPIYLITVFSKCEPDERWGYNIGSSRTVGFRHSLEDAMETVETNICDIWERCYDYACIEEIEPYLYPIVENRWFYEYDAGKDRYEQKDIPVVLKTHCPIGGIG